jgi:hypothetical protein
MSTTVSHPIPSTQAQAIADLTGYEDAATLRWQQACVQAANTLTALPNSRYVRSCIRPLRIIHSAQEPATMPSFHRYQWGHCHGTDSLFLRTRAHCSAVGIPHALLAVAERLRCPSPAAHTVQTTPTPATHSTQTLYRTSPEALLRPV